MTYTQHPLPNTKENQARTFVPDFVLVRKLVRGLSVDERYDNALLGLLYAGLPAVNSLESVFRCLEVCLNVLIVGPPKVTKI